MDAFMGAAAKASNPDKAPEEEDGALEDEEEELLGNDQVGRFPPPAALDA